MGTIFVGTLEQGYDAAVARSFDAIGLRSRLRQDTKVAIKPNLTFPTFRPGVMTNPAALASVLRYLKQFTPHITVCESDSGGYNPFSISEVFEKTGIAELARKLGVQLVNMTHEESRVIEWREGFRRFKVPLPTLLLDHTDVFITMPVPKVHLNTTISLGLKNQWGVIQSPALRLKLHPYFASVVYEINRRIPKPVVALDGQFGLTRSGPMRGDAVDLGWWIAGDDVVQTDLYVARLMGIEPRKVGYLRYAMRKARTDSENVHIIGDPDELTKADFFLRREWTDIPGFVAFHSRPAAYVGYQSWLARPLHWLLYRFREPFY